MGKRAEYDPEDYPSREYSGVLGEDLKTEFSGKFVDGMKDRMIVSYHKYGKVSEGFPEKVNALESMQRRLETYAETGNAEFLIDAANFLMIEFMHPSHEKAHLRGTDSDESPGRVRSDGEVNQNPNKAPDLSLERLKAKFARGD